MPSIATGARATARPVAEIGGVLDTSVPSFDPILRRRRARTHAQRTRRRLALGAIAALAVTGLVATIVGARTAELWAHPAPPPASAAAGDPPAIQRARQRVAEAPCGRDAIVQLADALLLAGRNAEVIATAADWIARCGDYPYLGWKTFQAHRKLGQWAQALAVIDPILAGDPGDSDYWWWRGEVYEQVGRRAAAVADYRQSLAASHSAQAGVFAAARLVGAAPAAGRRCDLVAALRYYVDELDGNLTEGQGAAMRAAVREPRCAARVKGGRAARPVAIGAQLAVVEARIGGVAGRFLVDEGAGTSVVTRAFAARAGLAAGADTAQTFAAGALRTGALAAGRVELGALSAADVDVVIVDSVPRDADGVVGLDFLWLFDARPVGGRVMLVPRR